MEEEKLISKIKEAIDNVVKQNKRDAKESVASLIKSAKYSRNANCNKSIISR